jgi:hypothetical protein
MTEYIKERAQEMADAAQANIAILDELITHVLRAQTAAEALPRNGALIAFLLSIQADLINRKASCTHVIAETLAIQRETKEVTA